MARQMQTLSNLKPWDWMLRLYISLGVEPFPQC